MKIFNPPPEQTDALGALIAFWLAIALFVAIKLLEWPWGR